MFSQSRRRLHRTGINTPSGGAAHEALMQEAFKERNLEMPADNSLSLMLSASFILRIVPSSLLVTNSDPTIFNVTALKH